MSKTLDTSKAIEIAPSIYWVGMHLKGDPFQCHPYLIKNGNESILIDPGSMLEFDETVRKIKTLIHMSDIRYIILHHQDPDLAAAVPEIEKLINRDDLLIVTHSRMSLLVKHYLIKSSYYEIDRHENSLTTSTGLKLDFLTTPYCHSPGAFVSYESNSKVLFSGDIFGGIEESWDFYADESYFAKAKLFHQEYMPSKDIFNYALGKIEKLDIELIAPQHGSIIEKKYIPKLIEDMKNLDCGLYIEQKYNRELLDTIQELQRKEAELRERDLLLFEQSKRAEIGEMIGNIAHQWRQPLAIINTSLAILQEKNRANLLTKEEIADKLEKMEKRIAYLSETIEDFMSYYSPGKEKSWFSIDDAVKKSLEIIHFNETVVKLDTQFNSTVKIFALINEYVQVIVSILSNINDLVRIKNLPQTTINITVQKIEEFATLTIEDSCGGIEDENLSKIFNPYFTTKHKSMGTGLGLHIAKMIIEDNMKGFLTVQNIYNEKNEKVGAKFTIKVKNEE
ncbi:MAG: ATP-binding protein [Sulfurimonas sp.]|uniref:ATP-binding protein n=1 Tax=Sulfurimonas sp. TaxID=2022749 RepID=UPI0026038F59|nr:ATP-binding protein [Sulfurimonas sp.]MDD2653202.1 ATP-binding protein [Sulfurimonas sp.]MDD3452527.1 ATP-binding protein [Sulfurimonas sp.]